MDRLHKGAIGFEVKRDRSFSEICGILPNTNDVCLGYVLLRWAGQSSMATAAKKNRKNQARKSRFHNCLARVEGGVTADGKKLRSAMRSLGGAIVLRFVLFVLNGGLHRKLDAVVDVCKWQFRADFV